MCPIYWLYLWSNAQVDNAQVDRVMLMDDLKKHGDSYSKVSDSLCQYYRDDPDDNIINSEYLNLKPI